MKTVKCVSVNSEIFNNVSKDLEDKLKIHELQTYFPIISQFFKIYNNSNKQFTLKSSNYIVKIKDELDYVKEDTYIKHFFTADVKNYNTNEIQEKNIFIKILPILNVIPYMMDEYNVTKILPDIYSYITNKKVNSINNSAYIDSFFSYLGSNLTENGKCPTFPTFYGTFSGISESFKFDISEEYSMIKNEPWFIELKNKLFSIETIKLDKLSNTSKSISNFDISDIASENELDSDMASKLDSENELDSENDIASKLDSENELDSENKLDSENELDSENKLDSDIASKLDSENELDSENVNDLDEMDINYSIGDIKIKKVDLDNTSDTDNSFSTLSASICSNNSFLSFSIDEITYANMYNFPVQLNCIEMLDKTLDNYLEENNGKISDTEWLSILFQICFGLAVSQKHYNFVHNDLHSSNIMFKKTNLEYLYFKFKDEYFRIPTFGKIVKIIDFGRATFTIGRKLFFSDVFRKNGDAEGQYSYPYNNSLNNCKIKPNKSFDLSRLSTTIIEHFDEDNKIYKLLKLWASDKYGNFLMNCEDDFNLYKIIAKNVISAVPKHQLNKLIFKEFIIESNKIDNNKFIYVY